ncbi:MAG: LysM peptidoglycan-binding domain-containing protein [Chloroflexi bacterium]|nr:LysM peptidoglycan-binding domain-containing protein [Chloroflexota bacterium]
MTHKSFARLTVLALLAMLAALIPLQVRAGGVCGGAYTIDQGDTVDKLAAMCGTTSAAIFSANPGLKEPLTVGQVITIPGANYGVTTTADLTGTPAAGNATAIPGAVVNNYYYYYYNYYYANAPVTYTNTYIVQAGDTFANIAARYGVSVSQLWAANPQLTDINVLYIGQLIYIPNSTYYPVGSPTATQEPQKFSDNSEIPKNAAYATVWLVNKSETEVYISLHTSRADGTNGVNEYPVKNRVSAEIPTGWVDYVAYVGGRKFTGGFMLKEGEQHTITFNRSKVVVD